MKSRLLNLFVAMTCLILFVFGQNSHAQEVPKKPTKTVYTLCGGTCNRSMEIVATFDGIEAACRAAERLRQTRKYVGIMTGKHVNPCLIHPAWRSELKPESCSVARRNVQIRCSPWVIDRLSMDLNSAEATVTELRMAKQSAEVIYHLPDNE